MEVGYVNNTTTLIVIRTLYNINFVHIDMTYNTARVSNFLLDLSNVTKLNIQ